jgi:hypothetical protein
MKKGLLTLLAGVMAFGVAVQSMASARIDSMASDPRQVEDIDLIWFYPNKVLQYKGTVDIRFQEGAPGGTGYPNNGGWGNGTGEWGGLLEEVEGIGIIGAYVNRPAMLNTAASYAFGTGANLSTSRSYWSPVGNIQAYLPGPVPDNKIDLFWANELENANVGVHVNYGDVDTNTFQRQTIGIGVGLGLTELGPFNEANFHANYAMLSSTFTPISPDGESDGISTIKAGALLQADAGSDIAVRTFVDLVMNGTKIEEIAVDMSDFGVVLGLSCNHSVNGGKGLVSHGLKLDYFNATDNEADTSMVSYALLWNVSLETQVANWLSLRLGLVKTLLSRVYVEGGVDPWFDDSLNTPPGAENQDSIFTTGLAVNWQNFVLDCTLNAWSLERLIAGPNAGAGIFYPGGQGATGNGIVIVSQADLKYRF